MAKKNLTLKVECDVTDRGEEAPQRLHLGQRQVEVRETLDRWLDPAYRYFKLRGDDDGIYILRHDLATGHWELTLFDSGQRDDTKLSST